jgi:rhodanese-related sulfurtransferase
MIILDVREREEFSAEFIPDSICCPLSEFDLLAPGILKNIKDSEILLMCRSGNRSKMALHELKKFNLDQHKFTVFEGGMDRWKIEGKTTSGSGAVFPLMRQVQIVASTLIFMAFLGAKTIAPEFVYLALLVGFGLALSGYTGVCPMVFLLQKMPWNNRQNKPSTNSSQPHDCC